MREVLDFLSTGKGIHDPIDVRLRQLIVICDLDTLVGSINEENSAVWLSLLQHHDACGYTGPKEQITRKLDHAVYKVVINQILPDLLLSTAAIHNAREADDGSSTIRGKPRKAMHNECKISGALWS